MRDLGWLDCPRKNTLDSGLAPGVESALLANSKRDQEPAMPSSSEQAHPQMIHAVHTPRLDWLHQTFVSTSGSYADAVL